MRRVKAKKTLVAILAAAAVMVSTGAHAGISKNNRIEAGNSLLLGGTQARGVDIDGQNRGQTELELYVRQQDTLKFLSRVSPGKSFYEFVPKNQTLVIRNTSDENSGKVYWHISGYSKSANPRQEVNGD